MKENRFSSVAVLARKFFEFLTPIGHLTAGETFYRVTTVVHLTNHGQAYRYLQFHCEKREFFFNGRGLRKAKKTVPSEAARARFSIHLNYLQNALLCGNTLVAIAFINFQFLCEKSEILRKVPRRSPD